MVLILVMEGKGGIRKGGRGGAGVALLASVPRSASVRQHESHK